LDPNEWQNITDFVVEFVNTAIASQSVNNQTLEDLRDRVCDTDTSNNILLRLLYFSNQYALHYLYQGYS
jgi:hypothetical protein